MGETSLTELENCCKALHCENDQTKLHRILTTGMFNLIVKDPRRFPPERAALDQGIRSLAACPRTCCAAYAHFPRVSIFSVLRQGLSSP